MTEPKKPPTTEPMLTLEEVAAQVKLSKKTIYRAAKSGELQGVQIRGKRLWRFKQEWIDTWIASSHTGDDDDDKDD